MASSARRLSSGLLPVCRTGLERWGQRQVFSRAGSSGSAKSTSWKFLGMMAGSGLAGGLALGGQVALANELELTPPELPWYHKTRPWHSLDHASMRRGFQVYSQVCAACHTLKFVKWRHLIGVTHTEKEVKELAAEHQYLDGPDDNGNMFHRPGKPSDGFPLAYPNEQAARAANNGAYPPELSLVLLGRHHQEDYVFHLLTSYCDAPAGVTLGEGQHYHPYFPGQAIGMAKALYEGVMEYDDGTPATVSQMAKDVTTFLAWTGEIHQDDRKRIGLKALLVVSLCTAATWYWNRRIWAVIKSQKAIFTQLPKRR